MQFYYLFQNCFVQHLLKHLKRFAKNKQLGFELSDQDDLEPDMAKREHTKSEGLNEAYYAMGKKASYSDNVPTTKIILQHTKQIEEGEQRYRNIAKIFVENTNGERFLVPTNKPGLARVYARHIAEGGTPYDERGHHITSLCEEYGKMAGFVRATRNKQFNESAQKLVVEGINHYVSLRETLHKMSGKRGYTEYFNNYNPPLMEDEEQTDLSEMFMSSSLDPRIESVMPILSKLSKNITETAEIAEVKELEEWADSISEADGQTEKQRYTQAAKDVLKGADPDHLTRVRNLDPEIFRKHISHAHDKLNSGEYKINRPNLEEENLDEILGFQIGQQSKPTQKSTTSLSAMRKEFEKDKPSEPEKVSHDLDPNANIKYVKHAEGMEESKKDDGLIAGRYTPDEWAEMLQRVKQLAHKQEAEKKAKLQQAEEEQREFQRGNGMHREFRQPNVRWER
jgi:hypothetical protein